MILFTWTSFAIGVQSSRIVNAIDLNKPYEKEWKDEEKEISELAVPDDETTDNTTSFQKVKNFIQGNKTQGKKSSEKRETKKNTKPKKATKGKTSRVSALASRRRK